MKLAVLMLVAGLTMTPCSARQRRPLQHRLQHQRQRIRQGVRHGALTHGESRRLWRGEHRIAATRRRAWRSGHHLTVAERARIARMENRQNRRIYRAKHNPWHRH